MSDNGGNKYADEVDILHVGAGIMSATLCSMLHELEPDWSQMIFERLDGPAEESSYPFNNAGTGHSALCELNYTPEKKGRIDVSKAMAINEKFQLSRQFWSYQVENDVLTDPRAFINPVPHVSFAQGEDQISYLRKRYEKLSSNHMFPNMQFTDERETFAEKLPLMSQLFPRVELRTVQGAGHWVHSEQPKVFTEVLARFRTRELSPVEYLEALTARIEDRDDDLGALTEVVPEATASARERTDCEGSTWWVTSLAPMTMVTSVRLNSPLMSSISFIAS